MLQITDAQKEQMRLICNKENDTGLKFITVTILRRCEMDHLIINNVSYNMIFDNDNFINIVDKKWKTNAGYRNGVNVFCNPHVNCMNIGLMVDDIHDVKKMMQMMKMELGKIAWANKLRLVIGDSINTITDAKPSDLIFKDVPEDWIVDVIMKYFRELFL